MEIVHIVRQYSPSVGGLEDAVQNLCIHLSRIPGVSARVITLNRLFTAPETELPAEEVVNGIRVTRVPYSGSSRYPFAPSILKQIESADIVHVHAVDFFFDFLSLTRFLHRKPLVASTHGGFFHTPFAARLKKLFFQTVTRLSCTGYKTICASSENDASTFRRIANNVATIENGVNIEKWADTASKAPMRRMIFIGRWSANKRVLTLIKLLAELRRGGQDWKLTIAGIPSDETVDSLTQAAANRGVSSAVELVTNPTQSEIATLIDKASYIVSASSYEGFGISIIEGLSAGLLPLVTPLPPFERLLKALGFGEYIRTENLPNTAKAIEAFHVQHENSPLPLRTACMALSRQYAWEGVAKKFHDVYKAAISKP